MKRLFAFAVLLFAATLPADEPPDVTLMLDVSRLAPGTTVKLEVRAEYNVVALPPRGTADHPMRPVAADRIKVHGRAREIHTLEFVTPAPQVSGRKLTFRLPRGLVRPNGDEFSALAFPATFTVRLPGATRESTGAVDLSMRWEPGEGAVTRCLKLDSAPGRPFRMLLLQRCDQVSAPLHTAPAARD